MTPVFGLRANLFSPVAFGRLAQAVQKPTRQASTRAEAPAAPNGLVQFFCHHYPWLTCAPLLGQLSSDQWHWRKAVAGRGVGGWCFHRLLSIPCNHLTREAQPYRLHVGCFS